MKWLLKIWQWLRANKYQRRVWRLMDLGKPESSKIRELSSCITCVISGNEGIINAIKIWVIRNIEYVTDQELFGKTEHWQSPNKTLLNRKGDCEDFSLLLACLLIHAGIDADKLRFIMGPVSHLGQESYHAYLLYEQKGSWRILDTTFRVLGQDTDLFSKGKYVANEFYKKPDQFLTLKLFS